MMEQQQSKARGAVSDFDHHVVLFPTRYAVYVPAEFPAQSAGLPACGVLPTVDGAKIVWAER